MRPSISKKPNLDEYDNSHIIEMLANEDAGAIELSDFIENSIKAGKTYTKKGKGYKQWRKDLNDLIKKFNEKFGRGYKRV